MLARARDRAIVFAVAAMIVGACTIPVCAQTPFSFATYEKLLRPLNYLRGRASPYVDRKTDFFGGIDAAKAVTFVWAGATWSPKGTLVEDGWRIRFMGAGGLYTYETSAVPGGINDVNAYSAELLGGYRKTFQDIFGTTVYAAAFVGLFHETQLLSFADPSNPAQGGETGMKGSVELYARVWQHYILTAFANASNVHNKYYVKGAVLRELNEMWGVGAEFATMGDARYSENRMGVAGTFTWQRKIFALSLGALDNSGRGSGFYTTFSIYSPL
jgi:hypothetical protein